MERIRILEKMELIAPCHFGLEAVLKRRLRIWAIRLPRWKTDA